MNKKEFEILYALKKYGMTDYKKAKYLQEIDNNTISSILNTFLKKNI